MFNAILCSTILFPAILFICSQELKTYLSHVCKLIKIVNIYPYLSPLNAYNQKLSFFKMLFLGANLLANLSIIITYENFITFGLVTAIPVCAGK